MIFSTFMRCSLNFLRCTFSEESVSGAYKSGITPIKSNMLKAEEIRLMGIGIRKTSKFKQISLLLNFLKSNINNKTRNTQLLNIDVACFWR
jgi:hypothetical protein